MGRELFVPARTLIGVKLLTIAEGKNTPFIYLVVGDIDREFFTTLIDRAELLLQKKIRTALYAPEEFDPETLKDIPHVSVFRREKGEGSV